MNAKQKLYEYIPQINKRLEKYFDQELALKFGFNTKQKALVRKMLLHAKEHNLRPAKRLRASFVHYGYLLGNSKVDERIWKAAMSVELIHTALLMHDDVMDQDDKRRGQPTTHRFFENGDPHYGESMAYTLGDTVLSIGYQLLLDSGFDNKLVIPAERKLLRGIANTAYGQAYDVTLEKIRNQWTENDVIVLHQAKTAVYTYENPLYIGAILGGQEPRVLKILTDYAMNGGVAFQLQDDILGVFGNPKKTGKSANSDLLQGKCTLLILRVFKNGTPGQIKALEKVWGKRKANKTDIEKAKQAIIDSGSLEYSNKISRDYAARAAQTAVKLNKLGCRKEAVEYIQGIAQYMVERDL